MGLGSKDLEDIFLKAKKLGFVEGRKSQSKTSTAFRPTLHPKAIILEVLEAFASDLRWGITSHQKFIEDQENQIRVQRQPEYKNRDGLARCSTFLSEGNVKIGLLRPKELFLAASLRALESCSFHPHITLRRKIAKISKVYEVIVSKLLLYMSQFKAVLWFCCEAIAGTICTSPFGQILVAICR
jgi:hypothetical protein